ncbi:MULTISPECIES: hypothetical protein [Cysteiniphilum]|uniref:hypothetical protein n=1 Tax=Cysteiniphilum TaxID=2056696 RepID=UPI00177E616F|nr:MULTISPECIES: hypothetical protein [Cysteiniphilum]
MDDHKKEVVSVKIIGRDKSLLQSIVHWMNIMALSMVALSFVIYSAYGIKHNISLDVSSIGMLIAGIFIVFTIFASIFSTYVWISYLTIQIYGFFNLFKRLRDFIFFILFLTILDILLNIVYYKIAFHQIALLLLMASIIILSAVLCGSVFFLLYDNLRAVDFHIRYKEKLNELKIKFFLYKVIKEEDKLVLTMFLIFSLSLVCIGIIFFSLKKSEAVDSDFVVGIIIILSMVFLLHLEMYFLGKRTNFLYKSTFYFFLFCAIPVALYFASDIYAEVSNIKIKEATVITSKDKIYKNAIVLNYQTSPLPVNCKGNLIHLNNVEMIIKNNPNILEVISELNIDSPVYIEC